ncbi:PTPLA-domain-containing protein [Phellopilus nigrolimitatus]|nr:PTPLA-domain-containing protein [Phellopilus nigrolimitatus]
MARKETQTAIRPQGDIQKKTTTSNGVKYYLVAYNALSALGWSYILVALTLHLLGVPAGGAPAPAHTASTRLSKLLETLPWQRVPYLKSGGGAGVPAALRPLVRRAAGAYAAVGPETALVQSAALLEVLHAARGWVRSPVPTTAMQVASRLFLVWGVAERFEAARTSPLYASMVLAWALTEVVRYAFYACSLLGAEPRALRWLRYSTFFVLYPLGAGSEAFVNYATLPRSSPVPSLGAWARGSVWAPADYVRGALFLLWWPGLYVMYTYMMAQRRKVLGKGTGRKLGNKPKSL